ncbi:MAG: adenylate/guanylate cyclase domain-containing protein [Parvularcula sp.]|nr:adenylate/guanylate cyclase domain-containing protein [Parvularcula sp.]
MFEQRQEQRLRLLLLSPAVVLFAITAFALLTAGSPGHGPRFLAFDVFTRLSPRPAAERIETATILVDEESLERLGPWPWPRSAFAGIVDAAEGAGAESVTLTIPVGGEDPLSPDVLLRRWTRSVGETDGAALAALGDLPSTDLVLARAVAGGPIALGVAGRLRGSDEDVSWSRVSADEAEWLRIEAPNNLGYIALPAVLGDKPLAAELREARVAAVTGLPRDNDGRVRRMAPLYAASGMPTPLAGLAGLVAAGETVTVVPSESAISAAGAPPREMSLSDGQDLALGNDGQVLFWLPAETERPSVPAWRLLDDPDTWGAQLAGKFVFIGETVSPDGTVKTARGRLPGAMAHALIAEQIADGQFPRRAMWSGFAEALAVIVVGAATVVAVIFLPAWLAAVITVLLPLIVFFAAYGVFRGTGFLLDPSPAIFAAFGGPLAVGATVLVNMVVRDDALRGAFHGALPPAAMRKLQSRQGAKLLRGVHREVTVLSCAFKLPEDVASGLADAPRDYVLFCASANDRLRRTILEHEGTVDFAEDGRLLGYWNVPIADAEHIERACACALKMLDDVSVMSQQIAQSGKSDIRSFAELADGRIEIGIASGPCFAGPVGLGGRNRYAALGPAVTMASRLRARSPLYGPAIVTDARVFEKLRGHYAFLDLDYVRRDRGADPEMIYGLVGNPFLKASKGFRTLADAQRMLLGAWREQDLTAATRALQKFRGIPGVPQPYVELFEARIMQARLTQGTRGSGDHADLLAP